MWDAPILKKVCDPVAPDDELDFLQKMKDTLHFSGNGVGLAAPQVGIAKRVIMLRPNRKLGIKILINPEIIEHSDVIETGDEGCLSYPGVRIDVDRWRYVTVRYEDERRRVKTRGFIRYDARILQHELDHLNGICEVGDAWRGRINPK